MATTTEHDSDREQDEEFVGPLPGELSDEERLLEALVTQAVEDCRRPLVVNRRGKQRTNPVVIEAFEWIFDEHADNIHVPFTFDWVCHELGWQPENFRRHFRARFNRYCEGTI